MRKFLSWVACLSIIGGIGVVESWGAGAPPERGRTSPAEHWADRLAYELEHLQDDLYSERGPGAQDLARRVEEALQSVVHFQRVLERGAGRDHVIRDFRDMDRQIHDLLSRLSARNENWVRRSASRIRYADEQLHYQLTRRAVPEEGINRELVARLAHVLEEESRQLERTARYYTARGFRGGGLHPSVAAFAEQAEHFHTSVERGADARHLRRDFTALDEQWQNTAQEINESGLGIYFRRRAQRVNEVQNQLHDLLAARQDRHPPHVERPVPPAPPVQEPERGRRPRIEFELPGLGRFELR